MSAIMGKLFQKYARKDETIVTANRVQLRVTSINKGIFFNLEAQTF